MTWYYMPCTSAPATPDSSSPSGSPESPPEPWLTLSGTPTQRPLSWRGWRTRPWIGRLSGLTCAPSTLARGLAEWTSSLPASPANRSQRRDRSVELTMTAGCGPTSPASLLSWDRDSSCWRTSPDLFGTGSLTSWPTLPSSGSMRNGVVYERPMLERRTSAAGSGSWPTPKAMWGTPTARDDQKSPEAHLAMKARMGGGRTQPTSLTVQAKMWPTPTAQVAGAGYGRQFPPGRDDADGWAEWVAQGGPEPGLRRVTDGPPAGLADALHLGGNGLVPVVAAHALLGLAERLGVDLT